MNNIFVIGVSGASASGKSTVCGNIIEHLNGPHSDKSLVNGPHLDKSSVTILSQDRYYNGGDENTNYDIPQAIDFDMLARDLTLLKEGKSVKAPKYDFKHHRRMISTDTIGPASIILVEGILIFTDERISKLCDLKVFVKADLVRCYMRRLRRDMNERGRSMDEIEARFKRDVIDSTRIHVAPYEACADIVINNNNDNGVLKGLEVLMSHINVKVNEISSIISQSIPQQADISLKKNEHLSSSPPLTLNMESKKLNLGDAFLSPFSENTIRIEAARRNVAAAIGKYHSIDVVFLTKYEKDLRSFIYEHDGTMKILNPSGTKRQLGISAVTLPSVSIHWDLLFAQPFIIDVSI
jgi:uridine kinase